MSQIYGESLDYYKTPRGQHPRSTRDWVLRSVDQMAPYESYAEIETISPRPLLMIAGTDAETKYFSEEAIEAAKEPKELFWVEGATHPSLYDKDEGVSRAVTKVVEFFGEDLGA